MVLSHTQKNKRKWIFVTTNDYNYTLFVNFGPIATFSFLTFGPMKEKKTFSSPSKLNDVFVSGRVAFSVPNVSDQVPTATSTWQLQTQRFLNFLLKKKGVSSLIRGKTDSKILGLLKWKFFCIWFMDVCGEIWKSRQSDTWDMQAGFVWEICINLSWFVFI